MLTNGVAGVKHKRFDTNALAQRFIDLCAGEEKEAAELQEVAHNNNVVAAAAAALPPPAEKQGEGEAGQAGEQSNDIGRALHTVLAAVIRSKQDGGVAEQGQESWTFQQVITVFGITQESEELQEVFDAFYGQ